MINSSFVKSENLLRLSFGSSSLHFILNRISFSSDLLHTHQYLIIQSSKALCLSGSDMREMVTNNEKEDEHTGTARCSSFNHLILPLLEECKVGSQVLKDIVMVQCHSPQIIFSHDIPGFSIILPN